MRSLVITLLQIYCFSVLKIGQHLAKLRARIGCPFWLTRYVHTPRDSQDTLLLYTDVVYAVILLKLHYAGSSGPGFKIWLPGSRPHGAFVTILAIGTASSYKRNGDRLDHRASSRKINTLMEYVLKVHWTRTNTEVLRIIQLGQGIRGILYTYVIYAIYYRVRNVHAQCKTPLRETSRWLCLEKQRGNASSCEKVRASAPFLRGLLHSTPWTKT